MSSLSSFFKELTRKSMADDILATRIYITNSAVVISLLAS